MESSFGVCQTVITVKLTQVEEFVCIADAGSIRAAARVRGVSQPAVTKNLKSLERELGAALVRRTARGIDLTPVGHRFLTRARNICRELERSRTELAEGSAGSAGEVVVGSAPGAAAALMPSAIARLQRLSPNVELRVIEGMPHVTIPRVRDGSYDFAIGPLPAEPLPSDVAAAKLFHVEMALVVRLGHPGAKARSLAALADYDWVTAGLSSERAVDEMFRTAGLPPPRRRVRCESISALIAIVARTDMVGRIPLPLLEIGIAKTLIEAIKLRDTKLRPLPCYLFTKHDSPLTPAAAQFAKLLAAEARRLDSG
jgi:LysR family transcriptional regulator of abg operon